MSAEVLGGFVKCNKRFPRKRAGLRSGHVYQKLRECPEQFSTWADCGKSLKLPTNGHVDSA
jgi:hypothetical protein